MDSVTFDGVEYVRAAQAAKQLRYTQDYIGQLCRGRKVDARLVGRTWYVNLASIEQHQEGRYQRHANAVESSDTDTSIETKTERMIPISVEARKIPITPPQNQSIGLPVQDLRSLTVRYEQDEESLLPEIHKRELPPPKNLRVEPAEAKRIRIEKRSEPQVSYQATPLPEVVLQGKLTVTDIIPEPQIVQTDQDGISKNESAALKELESVTELASSLAENNKENNIISDTREVLATSSLHGEATPNTESTRRLSVSRSVKVAEEAINTKFTPIKISSLVSSAPPFHVVGSEITVPAGAASISDPSSSIKPHVFLSSPLPEPVMIKATTTRTVWVSALSISLALVACLLLLSAGSIVVGSDRGYEAGVVFELETIRRLLSIFLK